MSLVADWNATLSIVDLRAMLKYLTQNNLRYALSLLSYCLEENLRAYPERALTASEVIERKTPELDEARLKYYEFIDELGFDAACELLGVMYYGRDRGDFETAVERVRVNFEDASAAGHQLVGKRPALEYLAFGFALLAGVPPDDEEEEESDETS